MLTPESLSAVREQLSPVGAWPSGLMSAPVDDERSAIRRIEALGYRATWAGEGIGGKEAFAHQGVLLASSSRIVTGTAIANIWARHPAAMQGGAALLGAAYPGRFVLGVGVSHAPMVDRSGQRYDRPLDRMRDYLDAMDAARADAPVADPEVPRLLAALRPGMLALAGERADGALPYLVPPKHSAAARQILGPDKLLVAGQPVVVSADPVSARRIAREHISHYLTLANYVAHLRHLGFSDEDMQGGGSDRLVDAIVAWGDEEQIVARVREHRAAGADHVIIQPLGMLDQVLEQLAILAAAIGLT